MKLILKTDPGCEDSVAKEFNAIEQGNEYVIVECSKEEVAKIIFYGQTFLDASLFLAHDKDPVSQIDLEDPELKHLLELETFALKGDDHEMNEELGGAIKDKIQKTVKLTNPDLLFTAHQTSKGILLGISLTKLDLRKRPFKIFNHNKSLRSTIAANFLRMAGFTGEEDILIIDTDGELAIEAALQSIHKSPFHYQQDHAFFNYWPETKSIVEDVVSDIKIDVAVPSVQFLKSAQKNAKIAGVLKNLNLNKADFDWLDTKFEEKSKDIIITVLACSGRRKSEAEAKKEADELAYQAKYLLNKNGKLVIATLKPDEPIESIQKHGFEKIEEHNVFMGEQPVALLIFKQK